MGRLMRRLTEPSSLQALGAGAAPVDPRQFVSALRPVKSLDQLNSLRQLHEAQKSSWSHTASRRSQRGISAVTHALGAFALVLCIALLSNLMPPQDATAPRIASLSDVESARIVRDAFAQSTQRLERLKLGPDQQIQAEAFLDAIGVFAPAYESMGLLFAVASKEVTNNVAKLRRNIAAREAAGVVERQSKPLTLQQLVEDEVAAGKQTHKDGSFEALRWLGFGLHFMEHLFQCLDTMGTDQPSQCAQSAYTEALRPHHGPALQAISNGVLRVVPVSPDAILKQMDLDAVKAQAIMGRWGRAVHPFRQSLATFYQTRWPTYRG